jgi:hypothetical protein
MQAYAAGAAMRVPHGWMPAGTTVGISAMRPLVTPAGKAAPCFQCRMVFFQSKYSQSQFDD